MSKYNSLRKYVKDNNKDEYALVFEKELLDYGYEFKKLSLKKKWIMIVKKE